MAAPPGVGPRLDLSVPVSKFHPVTIVPAMPAFYHRPKSVEDMIDQFVMKVLDSMGVPHSLGSRWKEPKTE